MNKFCTLFFVLSSIIASAQHYGTFRTISTNDVVNAVGTTMEVKVARYQYFGTADVAVPAQYSEVNRFSDLGGEVRLSTANFNSLFLPAGVTYQNNATFRYSLDNMDIAPNVTASGQLVVYRCDLCVGGYWVTGMDGITSCETGSVQQLGFTWIRTTLLDYGNWTYIPSLGNVCAESDPTFTATPNNAMGTLSFQTDRGNFISEVSGSNFSFDAGGHGTGAINVRAVFTFGPGKTDFPTTTITRTYPFNGTYVSSGTVLASPSVSAGSGQSFCDNTGNQAVTGASPSGGTWSGSYISSSGAFNTDAAPTGSHTVTYTYTNPSTGCTNSANKTITILALPTSNAGTDLTQCDNTGLLSLGGTPTTGGVWSGSSYISGRDFNTDAAPSGTYTLTYTVTGSNGCTNTDTKTVTINALPTVDAGEPLTRCINAGTLTLSGGTPAGGSWSGSGVSGSTFNPATAGVGVKTITYTYTDQSTTCVNSDTRTIEVYAAPSVDAGTNQEACVSVTSLTLTGGSPSGGTWSGTAVSGSNFNPNSAGVGSHTITYSSTNANGCTNTDTKTVTVNGLPTVNAGVDFSRCINAGSVTLSGASPSGGTWSGTGVSGSSFNPVTAGVGSHTLTYTFTNSNGCTNTDSRVVTVTSTTPVDIGPDRTFCDNGSAYNLNSDLSPSHTGGVWDGNGVSGLNFNPGSVAMGAHTITYTFTNGSGCVSTQSKQFTVVQGPTVDAGPVIETCSNASLVNLIGESPSGGVWSGTGVTQTNKFNPATTGAGVHVVTYTVTTANCVVADTRQIVVSSPTTIDAGNNLNVCVNASDFLLTGASRNGGIWSGTGVAGGFFSPSSAGVGTHTVTYEYTNTEGCISTDTRTVTVTAAPTVNAGTDIQVCSNGALLNLQTGASPTSGGTGTFSGNGVSGLNFNPSIAGVGSHVITYSFTNSASCTNSDSRVITVVNPETVTVGSNITACIDASAINLMSNVSRNGGTWSGPGVTHPNFSPASAGVGTHTIQYTVTDGNGCSAQATKTATVIAKPTVEAGQDIFVCNGAPSVSLDGTGTPVGGTWSGTHVSGNTFNVSASGSGTFTITYTYANPNGCVNTDTKKVIVNSGATVSAGADFSVCQGDGMIDLASRVTPGGGSFVGPGVNGNNFNPNVGPGTYTITYNLANSYGCTGSDQVLITVNSKPVVNPGSDLTLCLNVAPANLMSTAFPTGGIFSGPGVSGNNFDPSVAGVGTHPVNYTYTNGQGCSTTETRTIKVTELPTVDAGANKFMCINQGLVNLDEDVDPVNGTWTGPGITSGIFNPQTAGIGTHTLKYTITQGNGCSNYDNKIITVMGALTVDAGPDQQVCKNQSLIDLNTGASAVGGEWSGVGVNGNSFNPNSAGAGVFTITYNYENQYGCQATDTKKITVVNPAAVSVGSDIEVCSTASPFSVATSVSPSGGTWAGSGLTGTNFSPALAGIGEHELMYTALDAAGCTVSGMRTISVVKPDDIDAGDNVVVCVSQGVVDLDATADPTGGTWSGTAVSGSFFNPATSGIGTFVINYTYNHGSGCIATDTKTITVRNNITVDAGINRTMCSSANSISLADDPDKKGGTWSGPGVSAAGTFNPSTAGAGTHILTYYYSDGFGCSASDTKTITVNAQPSINAGADVSLCTTASSINLNNTVFPAGGTWSGPGITSGVFNPQNSGTGSFTLTYSFTDANSCTSTDTKVIEVKNPPSIDAGDNEIICLSSGIIDLDLDVSINGGTWTGTGISNNQFDPAFAGIGSHVLTYTYNNGQGCISSDTKTITVRTNPTVDAGIDRALCINSVPLDLASEADKLGGVWSGPGVSNSSFKPESAGLGPHIIRYTYTDVYGCKVSDTKVVIVNNTSTVDAGPPASVCNTGSSISLDNSAFPSGGSWNGPGVISNQFVPNNVGAGSYDIIYSYSNADGCVSTDIRRITVTVPEAITAGANSVVCQDSELIDLALSVSKVGGTWSGTGIEGNFFNPLNAGIGSHVLTYTYSNGQGCISVAYRTIEVRSSIIVDAGIDQSACTNSGDIDLSVGVSQSGGIWTGLGVSGSNFRPSIAGAGSHILRYDYTNSFGCKAYDTKTISVSAGTAIDAGPPATVCTTASPVDLTTSVSHTGGTWSGSGISGNAFNASNVGTGTYDLLYTFTNLAGCVTTDIRKITVTLPETITVGNNEVLCQNSPLIDLDLSASKIGGVWTGSPALDGSYFDASIATIGNHNLTYTYNNGQGCVSTANKTIQVRAPLTVNAGLDATSCINSSAINLANGVSVSGGVWSGPGVNGSNFNPALAGSGTHVLTYKITDAFGCSAEDQKQIVVNNTTFIDAGPDAEICTTASPLALSTSVSIAGGSWSGPGVTGNDFTPSSVGVGTFNLVYTYTNSNGCISTDTREVTVKVPDNVTIGANLVMCQNSPIVDLDLNVNKLGGSWSGSLGLDGSFFNPSLVPVGNQTVTYSYDNGQGCISTATKTIQVRNNISVDAGLDAQLCINSSAVNLSTGVSQSGGSWIGSGVTGSNFHPSTAGVGNHILTYKIVDAFGCIAEDQKQITVNDINFIDAGPELEVCTTAGAVDLMSSVSLLGGSWSGPGVTGNNFTPSAVGTGSFNLTYSYTNASGCKSTDTKQITVKSPPTVSIGQNLVVCLNSPRVDLDLNVSKVGGSWSGSSALEGSFFNPALTTVGNQTVTYTVDNGNGCISTASKTIQVRNNITVSAGSDAQMCFNGSIINLASGVSKSGGTWTGSGVSGSNFNPALAGPGTHVLTYKITDEFGCSAEDQRQIVVDNVTFVDAGPEAEVCTTVSSVDLMPSVSLAGGTWAGPGVTANAFTPSAVGTGTFNLTYSYTNGAGCTATDTRQITVKLPPSVSIGQNLVLCQNSPRVDLDLNVSRVGGSWSGSAALEGSFFNPALVGLGNQSVTYTVDNGDGCISTATKTIQVRNNISVSAGLDAQLCFNSSPVNLSTGVSKSGGTWTGSGISGSNFNPALAGPGTHILTYKITDEFGCYAEDQKQVVVESVTFIDAGPEAEVCTTATPVDLMQSVSLVGGTWSGPGVSGNAFNPSTVGTGSFNLTYSYTNAAGCTSSDTKQITVKVPSSVSIGQNLVLCQNSPRVDLDLNVSKIGGSWSGSSALEGSFFNPSLVAVGNQTVTYTVDNGDGCISTATKTIQVRNNIVVNAGPDATACINNNAINLSTGVSETGGTWTGSGISGSNFNPVVAGPGTHVLIYRITDEFGCIAQDQKQIVVNDITFIDAGPEAEICTTAGVVDLMPSVSLSGGTWSGPGVSANAFTPTAVGTGSFNLTYSYTNAAGCISQDTRQVTVKLPPSVSIGQNLVLCQNSPRVDLDLNVSKIGGSWSGSAALEGSFFNPSLVAVGNQTVTYTVDNGDGCVSTVSKTIQVRNNISVNAGLDATACINNNAINLSTGVSETGGTWSGAGVIGSNFNPVVAGPGTHVLTYRIADEFGCIAQDQKQIVVNDITFVDAGPEAEICTTAGVVDLMPSVSLPGGTWSGPGVSANAFTPTAVGTGSFNLTYSYTNAAGCISQDTRQVTVKLPPSLSIGQNLVLCQNSPRIDLDLNVSKIGGSWSGSAALEGSFFNPSLVAVGNQSVTYTVDNGDGCISTASKTIQIRNNITVSAGADATACINQNAINLSPGVSVTGGTWTGSGISGSNFNPNNAGTGSHILTYRITDEFGCIAEDQKQITVNDITFIDAGPESEVCTTASPVDLMTSVSLAGGTWSGPGVTANAFTPSAVGTGSFNLTYSFTNISGCTSKDTKQITVKLPETISVGPNLVLCQNSPRVDLDLEVSKVGGTWSGSAGLQGSFFDASLVPTGNQTVTYSYNNGQGCISTATKTIQVRNNISVNAGLDAATCINASALNLSSGVSVAGGTWTGSGVTGSNFNPQVAGNGTHILTYKITDEFGCFAQDQKAITVNDVTFVDAGPELEICTTASQVNLNTSASPVGGTWSGTGVTGNNFNPGAVGTGSFTVTYTYTNSNNCVSVDTRKINVDLPESISIGSNKVLCQNSPKIDLDLDVSKIGGTWSGSTALEGSFFNPALVGIGNHVVTYTFDNGRGCVSSSSKTIQVRNNISVNAGIDAATCINANALNLSSGVSVSGGTWSGTGVSGSNFNPLNAGLGNHILTYKITDEFGCTAQDQKQISVNDITVVDAGPPATVCTTAPALDLTTSVSQSGGLWSGSGVSGNSFTASTVGTGSYDLLYTYTNANGCVSTDEREITVRLPESVSIGNNRVLCANNSKIDLDLEVSRIGGTWSGQGIESGSFFDASLAGVGTHVLTYSVTTGPGCISTASKTFQVRETITVNAGIDKTICVNGSNVSLVGDASIAGGTWSGPGVSGTNFNPTTAGVGAHILTYTYQDEFLCTATDTRVFTVNEKPSINAGPDASICSDAEPLTLSTSGFPSGGLWSGQGVTANVFDPGSVGSGTYALTYTFTDGNTCVASDVKEITVSAPPVVEAGADFEICINAAPLNLLGAKPTGGNWSGGGVIAGVFDPLSAGLGEKTLTYSYTDPGGCTKSDIIKVNVLEEPNLSIGGDESVCSNATPISLIAEATIKGGTFTGAGVTGSVFNPSEAGEGTHVISYTVRYNGCDLLAFRNITVNNSQELEIGENMTVCVESNSYDLIKDVNIVGGTFTGPGLSGTVFDPSLAGVGSHVITYTFVNAFGCQSSDFRIITVQQELPINAGEDVTLCSSVASYNLVGRGLPDGGIFVGPGVQNNSFDPNVTGLGEFEIEYVVDNGNGCISRDELVITVRESTIENFGEDSIICVTNAPIPLNFTPELAGGTWSGTGVVSNVFYPSLAGVGIHTLNYANQGLDCDIAGRRAFTVIGLPADATSEMKSTTACEGDFITLNGEVDPADRIRNVTIAWYHENEVQPFNTGEEILYEVGSNEKVYYQAIDQYGCSSGQKDYIQVQTNNPIAEINSNETTIAFGSPVQFFASGAKNAESFEWDFGNGLVSYEKNPWHYYYKSGLFDITLKLTSASGCVTTILREDYLEVLPEPGRDDIITGVNGRSGDEFKPELLQHYPNPHRSEVNVELISSHTLIYQVYAYNSVGTPTQLEDVELVEGKNKITINTEKLTPGVYTLRIVGPNHTFYFKTIKL